MQTEHLIARLNKKSALIRKITLKKLKKLEQTDKTLIPKEGANCVNLNVHTSTSFSPYSAQLGAYMAYKSGITLAGICDYGAVSSIAEFENSCQTLGIAYVGGFELSVNDEQLGNFIASFYGVNAQNIQVFESVLGSFRANCEQRARSLADNLNRKLKKFDLIIDFDKDVLPLTQKKRGGTITFKHVYMALSEKIIERCGKGKPTADFIRQQLCFDIAECDYNLLCDANDPHYVYDLISTLRSSSKATSKECEYPSVQSVLQVAKEQGLICAYQYNGEDNWIASENDCESAVKQFQKRLDCVKQLGFTAVSICVKNLGLVTACAFTKAIEENQMLVILNEKTEYPRNRFDIVNLDGCESFVNKCAFAILGNAVSIISNPEDSMFSAKTVEKCPSFDERLAIFYGIGRRKV